MIAPLLFRARHSVRHWRYSRQMVTPDVYQSEQTSTCSYSARLNEIQRCDIEGGIKWRRRYGSTSICSVPFAKIAKQSPSASDQQVLDIYIYIYIYILWETCSAHVRQCSACSAPINLLSMRSAMHSMLRTHGLVRHAFGNVRQVRQCWALRKENLWYNNTYVNNNHKIHGPAQED